jgi:hypothetical protein
MPEMQVKEKQLNTAKSKLHKQLEKPDNAFVNSITGVVLALILLIGVTVILGWHLRLRLLVQFIPGTIPMQYNSGLCFILLAASTWIFISRRFHNAVPAIGSALVIIFSTLNLIH